MNRLGRLVLVLVLSLLVVRCTSRSENPMPAAVGTTLDVPVKAGSAQPRLFSDGDGTVWLSWVEPTGDDEHTLKYSTLSGDSWSEPTAVASGSDWFVNWADVPSVRPLPSGRIAAHYLESNGESSLAYAVRVTQTDGGGTWQPAVTPHDDGTETEHGFVSLLPWPDDRVLAVWLDGRKMTGGSGHQGEMTLRGGVLDGSGRVAHEAQIDGRTCECCNTSAVRVGNEALVAYRDRSEKEIRNIKLARFDGTSWSEPTLLHEDGWQISGCPVNGPALAADGERVVAAWFTMADGAPRVNAAFSTDGGRSFGDPIQVAGGKTKGRVDVVLLDDGSAIVSWLDAKDGGLVRARSVSADSVLGSPVMLASPPSASRGVGFPEMVHRGDELLATWVGSSDNSDVSQVRVVRAPVESVR